MTLGKSESFSMPLVHLPLTALALTLTIESTAAMGAWRSGTNACYGIRNIGTEDIQVVRIKSAENPQLWYEGALWIRAESDLPHAERPKPGSTLSFGGSCYRSDTGHQVPEAVTVSWQTLPSPGDKAYSGEAVGPYRASIRSRVPSKVLDLARRDGYNLELSLTAGDVPIYFNWQLVYRGPGRNSRQTGVAQETYLCIGGDSFEKLNISKWTTSQRGTVPVWPHCMLP